MVTQIKKRGNAKISIENVKAFDNDKDEPKEKKEDPKAKINKPIKPMSAARKRFNRIRRSAAADEMKKKYYGG